MVLLLPLAFFNIMVALSCMSSVFAERRLFCSSETSSVWYSYDGPLYYLSVTGSPCSQGVDTYNIFYTVIPMFTTIHAGYHVVIYYKNQQWLEHIQPVVPCEDVKMCYIIKGETLHDTFPFYVKKVYGPEGVYEINLIINIVDDLERTLSIQFNITAQIKNGGGGKNTFLQHLGVL